MLLYLFSYECLDVFKFFFSDTGISIEEVMLKDLKEISDGEIKIAISTVHMTLEVRESLNNVVGN